MKYSLHFICLLILFISTSPNSQAGPAEAYQQAINLAAQGHEQASVTALTALMEALPQNSTWHERMHAAKQLISMRIERQTDFPTQLHANNYLLLASTYANSQPPLNEIKTWPAAIFATLFPGAGHAWQGRWNDAKTAAIMVWPMLLLTLWAFKRGMGPVTLFFTLITLWLWSGTIFSSISLAERGNIEHYLSWWQNSWQSSGLPGRPW